MDIVIVAQYLRDLECFDGNNSRFLYIAKMLAKSNKNNIEILCRWSNELGSAFQEQWME